MEKRKEKSARKRRDISFKRDERRPLRRNSNNRSSIFTNVSDTPLKIAKKLRPKIDKFTNDEWALLFYCFGKFKLQEDIDYHKSNYLKNWDKNNEVYKKQVRDVSKCMKLLNTSGMLAIDRISWSAIGIAIQDDTKSVREINGLKAIPNKLKMLNSKAYFLGAEIESIHGEMMYRLEFAYDWFSAVPEVGNIAVSEDGSINYPKYKYEASYTSKDVDIEGGKLRDDMGDIEKILAMFCFPVKSMYGHVHYKKGSTKQRQKVIERTTEYVALVQTIGLAIWGITIEEDFSLNSQSVFLKRIYEVQRLCSAAIRYLRNNMIENNSDYDKNGKRREYDLVDEESIKNYTSLLTKTANKLSERKTVKYKKRRRFNDEDIDDEAGSEAEEEEDEDDET